MLVQLSLTFLISALQASAFPLVPRGLFTSIHLHRHANPSQVGLCHGDQARASSILAGANVNLDLQNTIYSTTSPVKCGSSTQTQNLVLDVISSDTVLGLNSHHPYTPPTSQSYDITSLNVLGLGAVGVSNVVDSIRIGDGEAINQAVGFPSKKGLAADTEFDGILGLGKGDHSLVNTAFNQGSIPDNVISLAFVPRSRENETGSVVTLGGVDSQHHTGAITHVPLTLVEGLGLNGFSHSLTYANTRLLGSGLLSSLTGVIDTRSTLTLLSTELFIAYVAATGAVVDVATNLLTLTPEKLHLLQDVAFVVDGVSFILNANSQILPTDSVTEFGGVPGVTYLIFGNLGDASGHGVDVMYGTTMLERCFVVFDHTQNTIGFANTPHTSCGCN